LVARAAVGIPLNAICAGLAGSAGRPEASLRLGARLREHGLAREVRVIPDAEVAFVDAFGDGDGILLIAGTGSIGFGRVGGGVFQRIGGWGALIGDEGSGYWVGLQGVRAVIRSLEGRGPSTALIDAILHALSVASIPQILEWSQGTDKSGVASLAPVVIGEADRGDPVASEIAEGAVRELRTHVAALRERLGVGSGFRVALVGGLVEPGGLLRERLESGLVAEGLQVLPDRVHPARGAVRIALESR
jgi:N-acetylglucosamine kinase-like BadF-type ATPase